MANLIGGHGLFPGKNNTLIGTDGPDRIFGDPFTTGADLLFPDVPKLGVLDAGKGGNDALAGGGGVDFLYGDAWLITGTGRGGNDTLDGGAGIDFLHGDANSMLDTAVGGNDTLAGGAGNDLLYGDALEMSGAAVGGNDTLAGGAGNDDLFGDAQLRLDTAVGGADVFVFAPESGLDTIFDFEPGKDLIDVRGYGAQSLAALTIATDGVNSTIDLDGDAVDNAGNEVDVEHVASLASSDFIFSA